ncbi:hypothetical protein, partial [Leptospira wolffii]|uniref:hypothetical protein n=1 Tax=Leptospira wolffii TaxID=409998 RepID=UPI001AEFCBBA
MSDTYAEFLPLFSDLKEHPNLIISSWAKNREIFYKDEIVKYREIDRDRYEMTPSGKSLFSFAGLTSE